MTASKHAMDAGPGYRHDLGRRVRVGLAVLAVPTLVTGAWDLFAPDSGYRDYTHGVAPPSAFGRYNEHFVQDTGGAYVAIGALLAWAAVALRRDVVREALVASIVFSVPHLLLHLIERGALSTRGYIFVNAVQVAGVLLAAWVWRLNERRAAPEADAAEIGR